MDLAQRQAISRGMTATTVDVTVIRSLLNEAYEQAKARHVASAPQVVEVAFDQAFAKLTEPGRVVKYHRTGCRHFASGTRHRMDLDVSLAEERGYTPCSLCSTLAVTDWAIQLGLDPSHVTGILRKRFTRIRKATAVRMLTAIGEKPHPSLVKERS